MSTRKIRYLRAEVTLLASSTVDSGLHFIKVLSINFSFKAYLCLGFGLDLILGLCLTLGLGLGLHLWL